MSKIIVEIDMPDTPWSDIEQEQLNKVSVLIINNIREYGLYYNNVLTRVAP